MKSYLQRLKDTYLIGWGRQETVILLSSALLLTLHRKYSRTRIFRTHFAEYFTDFPLSESYPYYYWFLSTAVTLFLLPIIVGLIGTNMPLKEYGIRLGNGKIGAIVTIVAVVFMIPVIMVAVVVYPAFLDKYPLSKVVAIHWKPFFLYQLAYGVYMFSWEFFFRGYMLFGLEKRFGNYSILIQTIPFAVMHFSKPFPEAIGSILAGVFLGVLAFETRSFIYGAMIHWFVAMTMDIVAISF